METESTSTSLPAATWLPTADVIERANITAVCRQLGLADYPALHQWSVDNRREYWELVIQRLEIRFRRGYEQILDSAVPMRPRWLPGARMNIVDSCFTADDLTPAVFEAGGSAGSIVWTYGDLRRLTARVASGLTARGIVAGDAVAVVMPMTAVSVAIHLGIIAVGATVVSIADSFATGEISTRLRLAGAKLVFTQEMVAWGGKRLPLFKKVTF